MVIQRHLLHLHSCFLHARHRATSGAGLACELTAARMKTNVSPAINIRCAQRLYASHMIAVAKECSSFGALTSTDPTVQCRGVCRQGKSDETYEICRFDCHFVISP